MSPVRSLLAQGACGVPTPCMQQRDWDPKEGGHRCADFRSALTAVEALCIHMGTSGHKWAPLAHVYLRLCLVLQYTTLPASECPCVSASVWGQFVHCVCLRLLTWWPSDEHSCMFACVSVVSVSGSTCKCVSLCIGNYIKLTSWGLYACLPLYPSSQPLGFPIGVLALHGHMGKSPRHSHFYKPSIS